MNSEKVEAALYYLSAQLEYGYIDISDNCRDDIELEIVRQALNEWVERHKDEYQLFAMEEIQ